MMRRLEYCVVLDAQPRERVDVEEPAVIDIARCETPMCNPVMLTFQQMMQRQIVLTAPATCAVGLQPALDDIRRSDNRSEFGLERRRFHSARPVQALIARTESENLRS